MQSIHLQLKTHISSIDEKLLKTGDIFLFYQKVLIVYQGDYMCKLHLPIWERVSRSFYKH